MKHLSLILLTLVIWADSASAQVRIKDITNVSGATTNQLFGFGLVVGLDGTGSRGPFTQKIAADMLQRNGVTAQIFNQFPSDPVLRSTSISAVMVTAELGPFTRRDGNIDVTVSAIDDARSLQGGTLIYTLLRGADGTVYATAQGPVSIGGFSVAGQAANVQKNHLNVGRIANGGLVVREALGEFVKAGKSQLLLKEPDFNTSRLIAKAINERHPATALSTDAGAVVLKVPPSEPGMSPATFLAEIGLLEVKPDAVAKVVINERTGTVVIGENVKISPVAVTHGNLYFRVVESPVVSQPNAFGGGNTAIVPRTNVGAVEQPSRVLTLPKTTTVGEMARALNALGVSARDLISIFQAMKKQGALHAEISNL